MIVLLTIIEMLSAPPQHWLRRRRAGGGAGEMMSAAIVGIGGRREIRSQTGLDISGQEFEGIQNDSRLKFVSDSAVQLQ